MKKNGFTLIEIVVATAILSIVALGVVEIFSRSFSDIVTSGQLSQDVFSAQAELEKAMVDFTYTNGSRIEVSDATIEIFDVLIQGKEIVSKIENPAKVGENNLTVFVQNTSPEGYHEGEAFITLGSNLTFEAGNIPVPPEMLNGKYTHYGKGRLVIPTQTAFPVSSPVTTANLYWKVHDGIYIAQNIEIKTDGNLYMEGNLIEIKESIIQSSKDLVIKAFDKLIANGTTIVTNENLTMDGDEIWILGFESKPFNAICNLPYIFTFRSNIPVVSSTHFNQYSLFNNTVYDYERFNP